jgi:hypothetical protein
VANGRKRKNSIFTLESDRGVIKGDKELLNHATEYYKSLFGSETDNKIPLDPTLWENEEKMSNEDNEKLCGPFTEAEFKMLFFKCSTIKLQGLIAYQLIFFKNCWGSSNLLSFKCSMISMKGNWM